MNQPNTSVANLFDVLASELQRRLSEERSETVAVSWSAGSEGPESSDLLFWSWVLSIDSTSRIFMGAPAETWRELCNLSVDASPESLRDACLSRFTPAIEQTAQGRFGSEVTCQEKDGSPESSPEWTSVQFTITQEAGTKMSIQVSVNPDLEIALGPSEIGSEKARDEPLAAPTPAALNSADILMDVEMPVSVSLGRAKMRLKNLLNLTNGSVVELDQELGDEVEVRVNNCVIAYGEVVAVDGNYAVRLKRMAPARNTTGIPGILPEKAA